MPKKKQPPNAFSLFVSEWKKQHETEFKTVHKSESEVLKQCEQEWKSCPEKQNHYRQLVAQVKRKQKLNVEFKYTCTGETYQSKEAETKEVQDFIDNMNKEIKTTVSDLSSISLEALVNYPFYFIHANYYIEYTTEKKFIPCEVGILEYTITEGICNVLHFFPAVDTPDGNLPLGYAFEAKDKADSSHEIPPPPFEPAESDFQELSSRVLNFLTKNGSTAIPPVYTMDDNVNCNYSRSTVCDFMELIRDFSCKTVRVYRLPLLFFELYNACAKFDFGTKEPFGTEISCEQELCVDPFLYVQGIACTFHTLLESDAHRFCSRSTVQRWAYIFSKSCCREVGIKLQPGKHCPIASSEATIDIKKKMFGRDNISGPRRERKFSSEKSKIENKDDKPIFQRPAPDSASEPIYKFGKTPGVVSEIKKDKTFALVENTGVRLPKTRGKADALISRQMSTDVRGFTKDEFPALGKSKVNPAPWKPEEPRELTKEDFPSLGGASRKWSKK